MSLTSPPGRSILGEKKKEPCKMLPDKPLLPAKPRSHHKRPKTAKDGEQAVEPAQDVPLTKEAFTDQMHRLTERAKAAGMNPIQVMAQTYARQGMVILGGLLSSLENTDNPKKKTKE